MKTMPVSNVGGAMIIIDDEDFDKLQIRQWHIGNDGYAKAMIDYKSVRLHRYILDAPKGVQVDHINHNKLDNRKANLRLCSIKENSWNRRPHRKNKSGYKGVSPLGDRWAAFICLNGKRTNLGTYDNKVSAAKAYDKAAKSCFGEYAYLNFS